MRHLTLCLLLAACTPTNSKDVEPPETDTEVLETDSETDDSDLDTDDSDDGTGASPEVQRLDDGTVEPSEVQLCLGGDTRAYVAWVGGENSVWLQRSDDGGITFLARPIAVTQGDDEITGLQLACEGDGVVLAWEDRRDSAISYPNIYANRSLDGGASWLSQDVVVNDDPGGVAISARPRLDLSGSQVAITWQDQVDGAPEVYVSTSTNTGADWSAQILVSDAPGQAGRSWSGEPEITRGSGGALHICWTDTRDGFDDVYFSTDAGGGFSAPVRLDGGDNPGESYSLQAQIAASGDHVYAIWQDTRNGEPDIFVNYSADGGSTWLGVPKRVEYEAAGLSASHAPRLLVDGDVAWAVWADDRNGEQDLYFQQIEAGVPRTDPGDVDVRLNTNGAGASASSSPAVSLDGSELVVAWHEASSPPSIRYNRAPTADTSRGWSARESDLATAVGAARGLQAAARGSRLHAAWLGDEGADVAVWYVSTALEDAGDR